MARFIHWVYDKQSIFPYRSLAFQTKHNINKEEIHCISAISSTLCLIIELWNTLIITFRRFSSNHTGSLGLIQLNLAEDFIEWAKDESSVLAGSGSPFSS